jgi:hypothetical protein
LAPNWQELAHEDEIERRTKRTISTATGTPTTRHRKNHRIVEPKLDGSLGESLSSGSAIRERS